MGNTVTLVGSNATTGITSTYFSYNTSDPLGAQDPFYLRVIANTIVAGAAQKNLKFNITKFMAITRINNLSNVSVNLTGYKLRVRRDLPNAGIYSNTTNVLLSILGRGYANVGIDSTAPTASNAGLRDSSLTIFQSPLFCECFKVVRTKRVTIPVSGHTSFMVKSKAFTVRPDQFVDMASTQTYLTGAVLVTYRRGETFWLFRAVSDITDQTGVANPGSKLMLLTNFRWTYKYMQDTTPVVTQGAVTGIVSDAGTSSTVLPTGTVATFANA